MRIGSLRKLSSLVALSWMAVSACKRAPSSTAGVPPSPAADALSQMARRAATPTVDACSLLPASDVGAILGKQLKASGHGAQCRYETDTSEREQRLAEEQKRIKEGTRAAGESAANGGDWNASFSSMAKTFGREGGGITKMSQSMTDLTSVTFEAVRDDRTEAEIKANFASTGKIVRGVVSPEKHGVSGTITVGKDLAGVGDWAFSTNVAAVSMGPGFSARGRLLETRKGPWHVMVGATVSPDPGEDALDTKLSAIARVAFERLAAAGK